MKPNSIISLLTLTITLHCAFASFKSYQGNCGYVEDRRYDEFFPLNLCMDTSSTWVASSGMYRCFEGSDNATEVDYFSFNTADCSGNVDSTRSVASSDDADSVFYCGEDDDDYNSTDGYYYPDQCYLKWTVDDGSDQYDRFIIMATCSPSNKSADYESWNSFMKCDSKGTISYVLFNDYECCELSYSSSSEDSPLWIEVEWESIDDVDKDSVECEIPSAVSKNDDVYTDNTEKDCEEDAAGRKQSASLPVISLLCIVAAASMVN